MIALSCFAPAGEARYDSGQKFSTQGTDRLACRTLARCQCKQNLALWDGWGALSPIRTDTSWSRAGNARA